MKDLKRLLRLGPWLRPFWGRIVVLLLSAVAVFSLGQANPLFLRWLIDWAIPSGRFGAVLLIVGAFFGIIQVRQLFTMLMNYVYARVGGDISVTVQQDVLSHLLQLDLRFFHKQQQGDLLARIKDDTDAIRAFLSETIADILSNFLMLVIAIAIMAWFNWKLALAVTLFLPIIPLPFNLMRKRLKKAFVAERAANGANVAFLQEVLSAILPIQIAEARPQVLSRQWTIARSAVDALVHRHLMLFLSAFPAEFVGNLLSPLLVLCLGGYLTLQHQMTVGQLVAAEIYATTMIAPVVALSRTRATIQGVLASLDRLEDILGVPTLSPPSQRLDPSRPAQVTVKCVTFSYGGGTPVLQEVSLTAAPGERVAIVGPSGAGKSTLAYLLGGVLAPDTGQVHLDGLDVCSLINRAALIATVPQEPFLFRDTVEANIRFGCGPVSMDQVQAAARLAQVDKVIDSLPEGYATVVGERGATLSGGERQRLTLARALLRQPKVLVLDEVTSALDATTEQALLKGLDTLRGRTTVFLITHRMAAALSANKIYVLRDGRIVEHGTSEELREKKGLFYQFSMAQTEGNA